MRSQLVCAANLRNLAEWAVEWRKLMVSVAKLRHIGSTSSVILAWHLK